MVRKQWEIRTPLKRSEYFYKMEFLLELLPHFSHLLRPEIHVIRYMHLLFNGECHDVFSSLSINHLNYCNINFGSAVVLVSVLKLVVGLLYLPLLGKKIRRYDFCCYNNYCSNVWLKRMCNYTLKQLCFSRHCRVLNDCFR